MLCNASTTCYVFEIIKTLEFMKYKNNRNTFKPMIWIPSQKMKNKNKQWTHTLNDLQRKKLDTPMLESILFKKKHTHVNNNSQPEIHEFYSMSKQKYIAHTTT